jgi:putative FmdB family regulatory protein
MPVYTYRREDGTTFDLRQKFSDEPLAADPETGQRVVRIVHAAGVIFKGSGFYVNDSKSASKANTTSAPKSTTENNSEKPAVKETPKETTTAVAGAAAD